MRRRLQTFREFTECFSGGINGVATHAWHDFVPSLAHRLNDRLQRIPNIGKALDDVLSTGDPLHLLGEIISGNTAILKTCIKCIQLVDLLIGYAEILFLCIVIAIDLLGQSVNAIFQNISVNPSFSQRLLK